MKNIEILHDALQSHDTGRIKELIKLFIYSNSEQKSNFDIYDYLNKKRDYREYTNYIYHKDGYKYATNSFILIKIKEEYPSELELKSVNKKAIEEMSYPKADELLKDVLCSKNTVKFPLVDTDELAKQFALSKKLNKNYAANVVVNDLKNCSYNFQLFHKLIKFAKHIGANELIVNKEKWYIGVKNEKGESVLAPKINDDVDVILRLN